MYVDLMCYVYYIALRIFELVPSPCFRLKVLYKTNGEVLSQAYGTIGIDRKSFTCKIFSIVKIVKQYLMTSN